MIEPVNTAEEPAQQTAPLQDVANRKRRRRRRKRNKKSSSNDQAQAASVSASTESLDDLRASVDSLKTEEEQEKEVAAEVAADMSVAHLAPISVDEADTPVSEKNILPTRLRTNVRYDEPQMAAEEADTFVDVMDTSFHLLSFSNMERTAQTVETWSRVPPEEEMPTPPTVEDVESELIPEAIDTQETTEAVPEVTPAAGLDGEASLLDAAIDAQFAGQIDDLWPGLALETKDETKENVAAEEAAEETVQEPAPVGEEVVQEVVQEQDAAPVAAPADIDAPPADVEEEATSLPAATEDPEAEAAGATEGDAVEAMSRDLLACEDAVRDALQTQKINLADAITDVTVSDSDDEPIFAGENLEEVKEQGDSASASASEATVSGTFLVCSLNVPLHRSNALRQQCPRFFRPACSTRSRRAR